MSTEFKEGKVKFYNATKGYGFITTQDGKEIFVHVSGILPGNNIIQDQHVQYREKQGKKGLNAVDVELI